LARAAVRRSHRTQGCTITVLLSWSVVIYFNFLQFFFIKQIAQTDCLLRMRRYTTHTLTFDYDELIVPTSQGSTLGTDWLRPFILRQFDKQENIVHF
jgi:hypothetical protein